MPSFDTLSIMVTVSATVLNGELGVRSKFVCNAKNNVHAAGPALGRLNQFDAIGPRTHGGN